MSADQSMAKAAYDELGHGGGCEYCDDSIPHSHEDVRRPVETSRARAKHRAVLMATVASAAAIGHGVATAAAGVGLAPALLPALAAALGWLLATAGGVLAATRAGGATARGMAIGALTPVVALGVALTASAAGAPVWTAGLTAAAVWLLAGAFASGFQARAWRRTLLERGAVGERMRHLAVRKQGRTGQGEVARWAVQAILVGGATALLVLVPVAVVVLVPGAVALAAWAATRQHARR